MKRCLVTDKKSVVVGGYSNRTRATQFNPTGKRWVRPNLQKKTFFVPEIGKKVTVKLSTKAFKTINKNGAYAVLKEAGII